MKKVKIYTIKNSHQCHEAKKYFENQSIDFEEIDLTDDSRATKDLVQKTGFTAVPQIEIGDKLIVGWDKKKVRELLED